MYKIFLSFAAFYSLSLTSFGAVNAIQLQLEGDTPNKRNTISRLLTNGTALVGDGSNVPQVVDIVTQTELTSTLASYLTISSAATLYQPLDSDLTSIAALTTTSFGRGLLQDANAAALRTTAGLVIGTDVQAYDTDLADLADGSLTGTKVGFADTDSNYVATDIQSALEELFDVNVSGPNAADGKIDWSQLVGVPAGFADGTDDGSGGGSGTTSTLQEGGVQVGDADIVTLNFGAGFDLAESPDTKITISLDGSEVFTGGDLSWSGNTPSVGVNAVALGTDTTGNYVATIADSGASEITVTGSGSETAAITLAIASTIARDSEVAAGYQPLDSDLTVIAGLADPNADRILFWDDSEGAYAYLTAGSGLTISGTSITSAVVDGDKGDITASASGATWTIDSNVISAYGRTLTDDADASTARSTLGLVIGTNVQAWDADLDDLADGTLTGSKVSDVATSKTGTQASPSTSNPLAPTWTTEGHIVYYGITGEIDLPAVATYANKTLGIYSTGTFTITVDPNGSEVIVEDGASLGAGVADTLSATAGNLFVYNCDGSRWIKLQSGGGITQPITLTDDLAAAGYDITSAGTVSATTFSGSGSGITDLQAPNLTGAIPDISTGTLTTTKAKVITPTAGVSNVVVTTDGETTIVLDATTETLTYSTTPPTGTYFSYTLTGHTSDCTVTIPSTYSAAMMGARTEYIVPANKKVSVMVRRDAGEYVMWGDPIFVSTLTEDTTPATSASIEIDQGAGGERATIANIKKAMRVGTKVYGSIAAGATGDVTLDWESTDTIIYNVGGNATHTLPLASSLGGPVGLMYQFSASGTITLDPNASDYIRLGATTQSDGVTIVITGTAGETFFVWGDGTNWSTTSAGNADVVPGS